MQIYEREEAGMKATYRVLLYGLFQSEIKPLRSTDTGVPNPISDTRSSATFRGHRKSVRHPKIGVRNPILQACSRSSFSLTLREAEQKSLQNISLIRYRDSLFRLHPVSTQALMVARRFCEILLTRDRIKGAVSFDCRAASGAAPTGREELSEGQRPGNNLSSNSGSPAKGPERSRGEGAKLPNPPEERRLGLAIASKTHTKTDDFMEGKI